MVNYDPVANYTTGSTSVELINQIVVEQLTSTSVRLNVTIANMSNQPTDYIVSYRTYNYFSDTYGSPTTISPNPTAIPIDITGLTLGQAYQFSVTPRLNSVSAQTRSTIHRLTSTSINSQSVSPNPAIDISSQRYQAQADKYFAPGGPGENIDPLTGAIINKQSGTTTNNQSVAALNFDPKKPAKSYLKLSLTDAQFKLSQYAIVYRTFNSISIPSYTSTSYAGASLSQSTYEAASTQYYTFGASLFMENSQENPNAMGGLGFFVTAEASKGYYVIIETTQSAASLNRKSVRIVKFYGNNLITLKETSVRTESIIEGIYGARTYNVDVKVKVSPSSVTINAYINGYKITCTDTTTNSTSAGSLGLVEFLKATDKVALLCGRGTVTYDYVYGNTIKKENYDDSAYKINLYQGRFNNDIIDTAFGDLVYIDNRNQDEIVKGGDIVDEFGTVVREIVKANVKFDTRPAYPLLWSTNENRNAMLIGTKLSSFGAEAYVLNNSSTTIPLQDELGNAFYVYGNSLGSSGTLEYVSNELAEYANPEPVIFESKWLQNLSDVTSLADWIKSKTVVVNRGRIVNLKVFGNPLISVGDIVSIKHTYLGIAGTESFIITNVNQEYAEGLETSLTCRSL